MYLLNGEHGQSLAISDRGLQYGDGLFETIAVVNGKPLFLQQHLQRLHAGCDVLLIPFPGSELLRREIFQLLKNVDSAVLKVIVTRGSGGRGYRLPPEQHPTRLLTLHPAPEYPQHYYQDGVVVRICQHFLPDNPQLAGIKHLNRLDQVLARAEWQDDSISEGLMLNSQAEVIEGTMSNVFIVHQGQLLTPSLGQCGINGIVRNVVLELAEAANIVCRQTAFDVQMLLQADEIFVTNSVIGVWPVRSLNDRQWTVGPVTQHLQALWAECCQAEQAKWFEA